MATELDTLTVTAGETEQPLIIRKELVAVGKVAAGKVEINAVPAWAQQWSREQQLVADIHGEPKFSDEF